jgi:hypothetical protein
LRFGYLPHSTGLRRVECGADYVKRRIGCLS